MAAPYSPAWTTSEPLAQASQRTYGGADQDEGEYQWAVPRFLKIPASTTCLESEPFDLIGHRWILLLRKGASWISLFLKLVDDPLPMAGKWPRVGFTMSAISQHEHTPDFDNDSTHTFGRAEHIDRGFDKFVRTERGCSMVGVDGSLRFRVRIKDLTETTAASMGIDYDSRNATGFVGLLNQGATCYMNSYLQSLFHCPRFRDAVYSIQPPAEGEEPSKTLEIGVALQQLFFRLQTSKDAPDTRRLTQSFGWTERDAFLQHDVQEFSRVLCDAVEDVMQGTVNRLFQGQSQMFVECINVDYSSRRDESFLDLQLNVKGCASLEASLRQYVEVETLDGENQYRAEDKEKGVNFGKQDARKGCKFLRFPPVLQLQLKRFEYDPMTDRMEKVNEHFSFPPRLDMKEFLPAERQSNNPLDPDVYHLHSILVHQGSALGGHYYSFIRPVTEDQEAYVDAPWFKFDDEHVFPVKQREAVQGCFGGKETTNSMRHSSAYMLVYLRESETHFRVPLWAATQAEAAQDEIIDEQEGMSVPPSKRPKTESKGEGTRALDSVAAAREESVKHGRHTTVGSVPPHVRQHLRQQKRAEKLQREAVERARKLMAVDVIWERDLFGKAMGCGLHQLKQYQQSGFALAQLEPTRRWTEVPRSWTVGALLQSRQQELGQVKDAVEVYQLQVCLAPGGGDKAQRYLGAQSETAGKRGVNHDQKLDELLSPSQMDSSDARISLFIRDMYHDYIVQPLRHEGSDYDPPSLHFFKFFDVEQQALLYLGSAYVQRPRSTYVRSIAKTDIERDTERTARALLQMRGLWKHHAEWLSVEEYFRLGLPWRDSEGIRLALCGYDDPRPAPTALVCNQGGEGVGSSSSAKKRKRQAESGVDCSKDDDASCMLACSVSPDELRWGDMRTGRCVEGERDQLLCELEPPKPAKTMFAEPVHVVLVQRGAGAVLENMSQLHEAHYERIQEQQPKQELVERRVSNGEADSQSLLPAPLRPRLATKAFFDSAADASEFWRNTAAWRVQPDLKRPGMAPLQFAPFYMSVTSGKTTEEDVLREVVATRLNGKVNPAYLRVRTKAEVVDGVIKGISPYTRAEKRLALMELSVRREDHTKAQLETHRLVTVDYCSGGATHLCVHVLVPKEGDVTIGEMRRLIAEKLPGGAPEHGIHIMRRLGRAPELARRACRSLQNEQLDTELLALAENNVYAHAVYAVARMAHDEPSERLIREFVAARREWKAGGEVGDPPPRPAFRRYVVRCRLGSSAFQGSPPNAEVYGVPLPVFASRKNDTLASFREKVRARLGVPPKRFENWKLVVLNKRGLQWRQVSIIEQWDDAWEELRKLDDDTCVGVCDPHDRASTSRTRAGAALTASAIKIER